MGEKKILETIVNTVNGKMLADLRACLKTLIHEKQYFMNHDFKLTSSFVPTNSSFNLSSEPQTIDFQLISFLNML